MPSVSYRRRRVGPPDAGGLGRERPDAALGKDGTCVVDECVDARTLADPRVADETDGALSANLFLQRLDSLQVAIEVVEPFRCERLDEPADVILVPIANLPDVISAVRAVFHLVSP